MISEEVLIQECKKENRLAQRELYNRYAPQMRALCYRYFNDPDEAKDILQEGFIKVFSKIHQYSGKGSLNGWVKRIIVNTAIDAYNKSKKNSKVDILDYENENAEDGESVFGNKVDSHEVADVFGYDFLVQFEIGKKEILQAIQNLPDSYKLPFNLFFIEKYSHKEISASLNINENTSRTRVNRARKLLQKALYDFTMLKLSKDGK